MTGLLTRSRSNEAKGKRNASTDSKNKGVKTKDLANDAVTSPKVADGTLLDADFAPGQLPQGPQGETGDTGPSGPKGDTGPQGERGPSGTHYAFSAGGASPASENIAVQLNVPAGDYAVSAVARGENDSSTTNPILGRCVLLSSPFDPAPNHGYTARAYLPPTEGSIPNIHGNGQAMLPATTVFQFAEPGTITYTCSAGTAAGATIAESWKDLAIVATQVATVNG